MVYQTGPLFLPKGHSTFWGSHLCGFSTIHMTGMIGWDMPRDDELASFWDGLKPPTRTGNLYLPSGYLT